jgi:prevent-host-death family protein
VHISVSEAKAQLTELVRRAEAGEEVVLTRHGHAAVRLVPAKAPETADARKARRRAALQALRGGAKNAPGFKDVDAARAADFLYDENGVPS